MKHQYYTKSVMGILMLLLSATASFAQFTITSPTANTIWENTKLCTITWTNTMGAPAKFNVRLSYTEGGLGMSEILATDVESASGSYAFILEPGKIPRFYNVCFEDENEIEYACSEFFEIKDPAPSTSPFTLTAPTANTVWTAGQNGTITWSSEQNAPATLGIRIENESGSIAYNIEENVQSDAGIYIFSIPASMSGGKYSICLQDAMETAYTCSPKFNIQSAATGISETSTTIGDISIYPVPVTTESVLQFTLKEKAHVKVILFDMLGKEISLLKEEDAAAGAVNVSFSKPQQSGVYFVQIEAGAGSVTRKIVFN